VASILALVVAGDRSLTPRTRRRTLWSRQRRPYQKVGGPKSFCLFRGDAARADGFCIPVARHRRIPHERAVGSSPASVSRAVAPQDHISAEWTRRSPLRLRQRGTGRKVRTASGRRRMEIWPRRLLSASSRVERARVRGKPRRVTAASAPGRRAPVSCGRELTKETRHGRSERGRIR
jgi:hypothetical protein